MLGHEESPVALLVEDYPFNRLALDILSCISRELARISNAILSHFNNKNV